MLVKRSLEDAKGASLMTRPNLSRLELEWQYRDRHEEDVKSRSREVLEGLQPHPNIKELEISEYPGAEFPTWMHMGDPLSSFPRGMVIELERERKPSCSPILTSLKSLHISSCLNLASLPHQLSRLTSLETLEIWDCPSLGSLPELGMQGQKSSLKNLEVHNYTRLTSRLEGLQHLTALESLQLTNCPE